MLSSCSPEEFPMLSTEKINQLIAAHTTDMVCMHNPDNSIRYATPSSEVVLGFKPDDIIGKKLTDFLSEGFINEMDFSTLSRFFDSPGSRIRYQIKHGKGNLRWLESTFTKIEELPDELPVLSTTRDITESVNLTEDLMEALSKERELSVFKTNLYSIASHEFKTPLAVIQANIEALKVKNRKDQLLNSLNTMEEEVDHLNEMIADMLELKKLTTGQVNFKPSPFDVVPLIEDLISELQKKNFPAGDISFSNETIIRKISGDYSLLRFAISNLISNACKFSYPDETVSISMTADDYWLTIAIKDRGIGIPKADQPKIFESFYRANNANSQSGTGVGLAITREFVDLHKGRIEFESEEGKGSIFKLMLPIQNS